MDRGDVRRWRMCARLATRVQQLREQSARPTHVPRHPDHGTTRMTPRPPRPFALTAFKAPSDTLRPMVSKAEKSSLLRRLGVPAAAVVAAAKKQLQQSQCSQTRSDPAIAPEL